MDPRNLLNKARRRANTVAAGTEDAQALAALAPLEGGFLPWTTFSMRPAAILAIVSDVAIQQRRTIVECGSGNSTVYIARLLARAGAGKVVSIDHDADWAGTTVRLLEDEGLGEYATVIHAPLVDGWYDKAAVPSLTGIDLLIVDGPPAYPGVGPPTARQPALDQFHPALDPQATVILDDAHRAGEREVLARWSRRYGRTFVTEAGGYAISAPHNA